MGKPLADRINADTVSPIIFNPTTVNNYKDSSTLSGNEIEIGNNIILDDGIVEKVPGTVIQNTDNPASPVTGLHRAYGKTTEKIGLRLANGILKSGPPAFATTVLSGLSTTKKTPFINIKGKTYGVNETDGLIRYDPKTGNGVLHAIYGPNLRKKIAFFESDETWTGGTADTGNYRAEEWIGNTVTSIKVTALASGNANTLSTISLDLSQFENGKLTDDNDLICFYTKHAIRMNINYITVEFSTEDTTYANKYMVSLYQTDFADFDYSWTLWKIKKGNFIPTGTPSWATVKQIRLTVYANANGPAAVNFDYMYLAASPIIVTELRTDIFACESNTNETWGGDATLVNDIKYSGYRSARVAGTGAARTASVTLATPIDLSKWSNGSATLDSDEFVFHIYSNDITALANANCLTLRVGQDAANYYYYTWATKALLGLVGSSQWIEVKLQKGLLDDLSVGAPNFTAVDYVAFVTSALTGATKYLYFDELSLQKSNNTKQITTMEASETWTYSNTDCKASNDWKGVTQGTQCIKLAGFHGTTGDSYCSTTLALDKDLTQWDDGSSSTLDDYISLDVYVTEPGNHINYIEIWFDNNSLASFANAYKYRFDATAFPVEGSNKYYKGTISIQKSSFDQIGAVGGWTTIRAVKVIANGQMSQMVNPYVFIDNLRMARKPRSAGTYYYKYVFMIGDVSSALSDISLGVNNKGTDVLLTNIKTSQDTRVTARKVYRLGGTFTDVWMLVKNIQDNTTTSIVDDMTDEDLVESMGAEVPQGYINIVKGNNLAYEPQSDRLLVWGDPDHKTFVWYSAPGFYLSFSADSYREFIDEVMYVVPWYGKNLIWYRNRMQKVDGDIETGSLVDIPINVGACSYWAVKPLKNVIPFVSWDNVYIMDGYNIQDTGDEIKGYFKGRETYLSSVTMGFCKDTIYIACKDKIGVPTYNNVVLRLNMKAKAWTILPSWNVNVWSNWDMMDDLNDLYYGDSVTGNIYSINSTIYRFNLAGIQSLIGTGWFMLPDSEIAVHMIELKAKGTATSTIGFLGYKNMSATECCSGVITLTDDWKTYTLGPKNVFSLLRGDAIKITFSHALDNAYFKMKDIAIYFEKIPKRITLTEVTVT